MGTGSYRRVRPLYIVLHFIMLSRCYGILAVAFFSAQSALCLALCCYLVCHSIYVPYSLSYLIHCTILDLLNRIIWFPMAIDDCVPINTSCVSVPNLPSDDCIEKVVYYDVGWDGEVFEEYVVSLALGCQSS